MSPEAVFAFGIFVMKYGFMVFGALVALGLICVFGRILKFIFYDLPKSMFFKG